MPDFRIFGIVSAVLFLAAAAMAMRKKFKYHRYVALAAIFFMLVHIAGALGLY
ncbi:MAG: hypothetical protein FWG57_05335 [Endomicrobia bacterium]|nr:hypothetical protein [Endomicrobiia bacterium]